MTKFAAPSLFKGGADYVVVEKKERFEDIHNNEVSSVPPTERKSFGCASYSFPASQ
jgi:hypothetical protein